MLKLPAVVTRAHAKRMYDNWMGSFGLSNALTLSVELQRLLKAEKKRRKELEKK